MDPTDMLLNLIENSFRNLIGKKLAVAFSGGIDSSMVAYFASKVANVKLYVVGIENSHDIKSAKESSEILNLPLEVIEIGKKDVENGIRELIEIINLKPNPRNPIIVSFELPLYFVAKFCGEKYILTGQGSDELFLGYYKYRKMTKNELESEQEKTVNELLEAIIPREKRICEHFGKKLITPFLNKKLIDFALKLSVEVKFDKYILRKTAEKILPEIAEKKKKAAQYGSGIMKVIKKLAKENNTTVEGYVNSLL